MQNILSSLGAVDYAILALLLLGLLIGAKKGFAVMATKVLALFGSIFLVFQYYSTFAAQLAANSFVPRRTSEAIVFVLIAVVGWFAINLVLRILSKVIEIKFSDQMSRLGGFLLGAFWAFVFAGFVLYGLISFKAPFFEPKLASESVLAPHAIRIPLVTYQFFFHRLPEDPSV